MSFKAFLTDAVSVYFLAFESGSLDDAAITLGYTPNEFRQNFTSKLSYVSQAAVQAKAFNQYQRFCSILA